MKLYHNVSYLKRKAGFDFCLKRFNCGPVGTGFIWLILKKKGKHLNSSYKVNELIN